MAAVDELADRVNIGPDDEIGSSDVSAYVREVERALSEQGVAEGAKEDMSKEVKAMATGTCPHCQGPVKKKEYPTLTQYHCAKCGIRASQDKPGVAEGYQLDEGAIETITALAKKIPGIGKYYQLAQQYKPQLIDILKTSKSGKEVKQKMERLAAGQSATVAESGMMKQLGGLAVGGGSILSTMWMNAMGMIDGVLANAAAGEVGGAVASGSILGLIPVTLMLFAAMLLFKGSKQSSDEKAQAFQAQRGQQGMTEDLQADDGERYRSADDFFGQFEADHFDEERVSPDGMEVRGYIDGVNVMVWRFDSPRKTSGYGIYDDSELNEAEYQGRKVPLGKPMKGDVAKSKVYVKDPKTGNVKKVNFGDPNMKIKKSNPARRKSFRARHNCDNPGPRTKARYWSCRAW